MPLISSKVMMNQFQRTYFLTYRKILIFESALIHRRTHQLPITAHIKNSCAGGSRNFVPCGKNTNGRYERSTEYRYFPYAQHVVANTSATVDKHIWKIELAL